MMKNSPSNDRFLFIAILFNENVLEAKQNVGRSTLLQNPSHPFSPLPPPAGRSFTAFPLLAVGRWDRSIG